MEERLKAILQEVELGVQNAPGLEAVEEMRVRYLGKKGLLTDLLKGLGQVPAADRPQAGKAVNEVKERITRLLDDKKAELEDQETSKVPEGFDPTLPGRFVRAGNVHPLTSVQDEICRIFRGFGFQVALGPDVETDYYNFLALNFPPDHPARDAQDTYYLSDEHLLRTHTSPVQVRTMEKAQPPFKFVAPGRVYRHEAVDATHHNVFHQVEGFQVDQGITFAHLKGVLDAFAKEFFGPAIRTRFRPSFFPFTEPSAEVDISCIFCQGRGCRICKQAGWVEMLGCGMIDPAVLTNCKIDPEKWTGYAFGMGVERIAMFKYGVDDLRLFYQNDLRFIGQFG